MARRAPSLPPLPCAAPPTRPASVAPVWAPAASRLHLSDSSSSHRHTYFFILFVGPFRRGVRSIHVTAGHRGWGKRQESARGVQVSCCRTLHKGIFPALQACASEGRPDLSFRSCTFVHRIVLSARKARKRRRRNASNAATWRRQQTANMDEIGSLLRYATAADSARGSNQAAGNAPRHSVAIFVSSTRSRSRSRSRSPRQDRRGRPDDRLQGGWSEAATQPHISLGHNPGASALTAAALLSEAVRVGVGVDPSPPTGPGAGARGGFGMPLTDEGGPAQPAEVPFEVPPEGITHACALCSRGFFSLSHLRRHEAKSAMHRESLRREREREGEREGKREGEGQGNGHGQGQGLGLTGATRTGNLARGGGRLEAGR
jgi:hypothetical protein